MIFNNEIMEPYFYLLEECKDIEVDSVYHPEGSILNHSLQAFEIACKECSDIDLILAALLHDVGKSCNSLGHDRIALDLLDCHCSCKTLWLIGNHMRVWNLINGEMKRLKKVNDLVNHPWLPELVMLARYDKSGRNPNKQLTLDRDRIINKLNRIIINKYD